MAILDMLHIAQADHARRLLLAAFGLMLLVIALDAGIEHAIGLGSLYTLPVMLASWAAGWRMGLAVAALSAGLLAGVDLYLGSARSPGILLLESLTALLQLAIIAWLTAALRERQARLEYLATKDVLTGLLNRQGFLELAQQQIWLLRREGMACALITLNGNEFRALNETLGHTVGDSVLQTIGRTLSQLLRRTDYAARLGGDEFALLLPGTGTESTTILLAKLEMALDEAMRSRNWPLHFSLGAAVFITPPASVEEALQLAGQQMQAAQRDANPHTHHRLQEYPL